MEYEGVGGGTRVGSSSTVQERGYFSLFNDRAVSNSGMQGGKAHSF